MRGWKIEPSIKCACIDIAVFIPLVTIRSMTSDVTV